MDERVRRQLAQCEPDQLLNVTSKCGDQVGASGAIVALHRLARDASYKGSGKDRRLDGLLEILRKPLLKGEACKDLRQFTNILWSFARLTVSDEPLLDAISAEAHARLSEFGCQELASTAWAFARLACLNVNLMESISSEAIRTLPEFRTMHLANMSWAFAKMELFDSPLITSIA